MSAPTAIVVGGGPAGLAAATHLPDAGHVRLARYLPGMTVATAIPTPERGGLAGRPRTHVPGAPGAFVAGDWVGPAGLLLDAALASARQVARQAADARDLARPRAVAA